MKKELEQHILRIGHLNDTLYYVACGLSTDKSLSPEATEGVLELINDGIEKEVNAILKLLDEEDANVQK